MIAKIIFGLFLTMVGVSVLASFYLIWYELANDGQKNSNKITDEGAKAQTTEGL